MGHMTTEELIRRLASDLPAKSSHGVLPPLAARLLAYTSVAALATFLIILSAMSRSPHLVHGVGVTIAFTIAAATALAAGAFRMSVVLSRPEARPGQTWIIVPIVVMAAGIVAELYDVPRHGWATRLFGQDPLACFICVWLLSMPILLAALLALRHGAPSQPGRAGAMAGLFAGAVAAALYTLHCPEDSLLFVAAWHVPAVALVAAVGAAIAGRMLRW
jgi:hypothetical protein